MNLCLAGFVFVCVTYLLPAVMPAGRTTSAVADQLSRTGWIFSFPFLAAAAASAVRQWIQSRILDQQKSLDSLRELSWQDFERLVGEAFRGQGYSVTHHGGAAPDGGIDLVIHKAGAKAVVQCKRWRERQVGVTVVRELFGVMTAEGANEAILVTCGEYTDDARSFAVGNPIRLVNGETLLDMVWLVQQAGVVAAPGREQQTPSTASPPAGDAIPSCPKCGSAMVRRTARSGAGAGQEFWGCSTYPKCRGTCPG